MNPGKVTPGQLFSDNTQQFWVPRYQRRYEWGPDKLHGLWQDLAPLFNEETNKSHFFGIILGSPKSYPEGPPSTRIEVIDGQQRITTLLILLAAIFEHKNEVMKRKPPKPFSHPLYLLTDHERKPTKHRILELQSSDGKELDDVMAGKWRKKYHQNNKSGVLEAFIYFRYCLWIGRKSFDAIEEYEVPRARNKKDLKLESPEELWKKYLLLSDKDAKVEPLSKADCARLDEIVRNKLIFLNIQLESGDEDPVVIFDSINGKRLEFSQWNHTRSYFFRTIGDNEELFNKWDKTEDDLEESLKESGQKKRRGSTSVNDEFLYNLLIVEAGSSGLKPNKNRTYSQLREYLLKSVYKGKEPTAAQLTEFCEDILLPTASVFKSIISPLKFPLTTADGKMLPDKANDSLKQIQAFSRGPADPSIMLILVSWHKEEIDDETLISALAAVESFLARYILMGNDLSPLRSKFMQMIAAASKGGAVGKQRVLNLASELKKESPGNKEIVKAHKTSPISIYSDTAGSAQRAAAILRGIEQQMSGTAAHKLPFGNGKDEFNVDHVLPQSCRTTLNEDWSSDYISWGGKPEDSDLYRGRIDTLGNLVLHASYANQSDRDACFSYKQKALAGRAGKKSVILKHTQGVSDSKQWTAKEIDERNAALLDVALSHWSLS